MNILRKIQDHFSFINVRLLKDHSEATGVQGTVMSNLRQKLEEVESELTREKLDNSNTKVCFVLRVI